MLVKRCKSGTIAGLDSVLFERIASSNAVPIQQAELYVDCRLRRSSM